MTRPVTAACCRSAGTLAARHYIGRHYRAARNLGSMATHKRTVSLQSTRLLVARNATLERPLPALVSSVRSQQQATPQARAGSQQSRPHVLASMTNLLATGRLANCPFAFLQPGMARSAPRSKQLQCTGQTFELAQALVLNTEEHALFHEVPKFLCSRFLTGTQHVMRRLVPAAAPFV